MGILLSMLDALREKLGNDEQITFSVKVRPSASKTTPKGVLADGTLKIDIAATPEDGKANEELVRFLAEEFDVDRSSIAVISGQTSRRKMVKISK